MYEHGLAFAEVISDAVVVEISNQEQPSDNLNFSHVPSTSPNLSTYPNPRLSLGFKTTASHLEVESASLPKPVTDEEADAIINCTERARELSDTNRATVTRVIDRVRIARHNGLSDRQIRAKFMEAIINNASDSTLEFKILYMFADQTGKLPEM